MRERYVAVKILYPEGMDDQALVILDKMSEFVLDLDSVHDFTKEFSEPSEADPEDWEDYFWELEHPDE